MVGICLIGAGRAGMIHAENFRIKVPGAKLAAIVEPDEEAAALACRKLGIDKYYHSVEDVLDNKDIDAVVIASPAKYHKENAVLAASAGKHILCEKPMAINESECNKIIAAAEKRGVKLQLGFMRRYDENFIRAKEIIDSGEIGDVVLVKSHTRGPSIPKPWMYDISKSNGPLSEVNSHDIDTLRWFTGSEFDSLYAIGANYRFPEVRDKFPDFYDNVLLSATFENGMQGLIDGAQGVGYGYDAATEVIGTKGVIRVGRSEDKFVACCTKDGGIHTKFIDSWKKLFSDAYLEEDIKFIECIEKGSKPRATGLDGKMSVRVVQAGNRSIKNKCIIEMNKNEMKE